ncbi:MAG: hypothetical protein J6I68_08345 [Butyrivibrio sp.]|uniref:hypothetical protein n=1 Tax=Butyrivibrio sp. TaxID=28121 RepID=UPI001B470C81|nr:hypothetical protein [Butyrivibrio sp.]MBP3783240.1 hypothetical protein [Butyrivibrio sp.]
MTRDQFIYALTACGCLLKDGKTWYEHNELIKCFEDLGLFEQEPVLDKIRAEIEAKYGHCDICEYFEDYDYEENDISEYRPIGNTADILQILDKYKVV